jgi:hypothetical protein
MVRGGVGVLESAWTGAGVGSSGVQHDRAQTLAGEYLLRPQHGGRFDLIAGEDPGGRRARSVIDHQRQIQSTTGLDASGHPGSAKSLCSGDAHRDVPSGQGAIPQDGKPVVSGNPSARLRHCSAAPAVPLVRLSTAPTATSLLASASTATCT